MNKIIQRYSGVVAVLTLFTMPYQVYAASPLKTFVQADSPFNFFLTFAQATIKKAGPITLGATPATTVTERLLVVNDASNPDGQLVVGSSTDIPKASVKASLQVKGTVLADRFCNSAGTDCKTVSAINAQNQSNPTAGVSPIPRGAIVLIPANTPSGQACPNGYSILTAAQDRLLVGGSSFGTGGTLDLSHNHVFPEFRDHGYLYLNGPDRYGRNRYIHLSYGSTDTMYDNSHFSGRNVNSGFTNLLPPYLNVFFCEKTS